MADSSVVVLFRGTKLEIPLESASSISVGYVRSKVVENSETVLRPQDVKLIFQGKILDDDTSSLNKILLTGKKKKGAFRLVATGVSRDESEHMKKQYQDSARQNAILVRDDLSDKGVQRMKDRQKIGQQLMKQARNSEASTSMYRFGSIETLSNLPEEAKARGILTTLANDPGIKACMVKHKWQVGSLAELYPKGKVGESAVCVMGLNRNKGQQILLRIRTDDLNGFRKMMNIREVLYHELAHNVHSEHNSEFFQLMRQIKKECIEMDWTQGRGMDARDNQIVSSAGGSYVSGGRKDQTGRTAQQLAAQAAILRLSVEEEEVQRNCGCGHEHSLFRNSLDTVHRQEGNQMDESP